VQYSGGNARGVQFEGVKLPNLVDELSFIPMGNENDMGKGELGPMGLHPWQNLHPSAMDPGAEAGSAQ